MGRRIRPKYDDSKWLIVSPPLTEERQRAILRDIDTKKALEKLNAAWRDDVAEDARAEQSAMRTQAVRAIDTLDRIKAGKDKTTEIPGVAAVDRTWIAAETIRHLKKGKLFPDVHAALNRAIEANSYRRALKDCSRDLARISKRSGMSKRQGEAWVVNEILDEREYSMTIHRHDGGRILRIDPSSFAELVEKANKHLGPSGRAAVRAVLDRHLAINWAVAGPMTASEYDKWIGPLLPDHDSTGVRTPARKVRYGPGDEHGDG